MLDDHLGSLLLRNQIGYRASVDTAVGEMRPVWRIGSGAARDAAAEVRGAIEEVIERCGFRELIQADREAREKAAKARRRSSKASKVKKASKRNVKTAVSEEANS